MSALKTLVLLVDGIQLLVRGFCVLACPLLSVSQVDEGTYCVLRSIVQAIERSLHFVVVRNGGRWNGRTPVVLFDYL